MNLQLPEPLRRVLPAARWDEVTIGKSSSGVYRSTRHVLKVKRTPEPFDTLFAEKEKLRWLDGRVPVPTVVAYHKDASGEYLAVTRLPGIDMSHADAKLHPRRNAELLARALRELHALPIRDCPFDASLRVKLREARERVLAGFVNEDDFDDERQGRRADDLLRELLETRPEREDLVVTHGDACVENVLVSGEFVEGFVDVGRAGIADRHADLALAARSLAGEYGPEIAEFFLDTYGRSLVDASKLAYYRLLDELF